MSIAIKEITVSLAQDKVSEMQEDLKNLSALAWQIVLINGQIADKEEKLLCHIHLMIMN